MVMAHGYVLPERTLYNGVYEILNQRIRKLCADLSSLIDNSLFTFAEYVTDVSNLHITKNQIMRDVTNGIISKQKKRAPCKESCVSVDRVDEKIS